MRSPDVQFERAGREFKGVLSVSADSSLGSKQNTSWGWVRRERCHKILFISHHGQTLIWRKSSTTGQRLLAAGRNWNEELRATLFEMSNVVFVWISWLSTDVERIIFVCPAWSNPGFIYSTWIHQLNRDMTTYKTTTNPAKTSWCQWCKVQTVIVTFSDILEDVLPVFCLERHQINFN